MRCEKSLVSTGKRSLSRSFSFRFRPGECRRTSQIAQPPICAALLEFCPPAAREVQNDNCRSPHQLDEGKVVAVAFRDVVEEESTEQQPCDGLMEKRGRHDRHQVKQMQVDDTREPEAPA